MDKLPRKPLLKAYLNVVPVNDELIQLRSQENIILLKGSAVTNILPDLLPLLDGSNTMNDIYSKLSYCTQEVVNEAILLLKSHYLLEDAECKYESKLEQEEIEKFKNQLQFFSLFSERVLPNASVIDKYKIFDSLKKSSCLVIGLKRCGRMIAKKLVQNGLGTIYLYDKTLQEYNLVETKYSYEDIMKELKGINEKCNVFYSDKNDSLKKVIGKVDLIIFAEDIALQSDLLKVNKLCIDADKPWISLRVGELKFQIGPMVVPNQTACYECFQNRYNGNLSFYEEEMQFEKYKEDNWNQMETCGSDLFYSMAANYLVWEVIKQITKIFTPVTLSRVITFDILTLETSIDSILKMPRCPVCSNIEKKPFVEPYAVYLP